MTKELEYNLYSKFDIQKHKETYINYLEVIILPNGTIEYAVPSHQEKLIAIGMDKYKCSRDEFIKKCPKDMWLDYLTWLQDVTGCISVWTNGYSGKPNMLQMASMKQLINAGLLKVR